MKALDIAKNLAKMFEGWSSTVYICPAGYPTIGWGRRVEITHPPITKEIGEIYLTQDMLKVLKGALKYCPILAKDDNKLAAIADFCFNLGVGRLQTSTLRRRINEENWEEAIYELKRWVYGGGKKLPGLVRRREAEARLFEKRMMNNS